MDILFVTCWYPHPGFPKRGIFIKEHAKALKKAGGNVKVLHIWPVKSKKIWDVSVEESIDEDGIHSIQILVHSIFYKVIYHLWPILYWVLRTKVNSGILKDFTPDLIHGHTIYPAGFLASELSEELDIPFLLTEHWTKLDWIFNHPLWKGKARSIFSSAQKVLPVSAKLGNEIKRNVEESVELRVIPNIVDDAFSYEESQRDDDRIELLCVTNFFLKQPKHKLPEMIAFAMEELPLSQQKKFRIRYIGPGQEDSDLKKQIRNLGLGTEIIFDDARPKDYVAQKMREADYLFHPSKKETFGVVVAEALCSGLPCVVSNVGALPELVNKESGDLLDNDVKVWTNALQNILDGGYKFNREKIATDYKNRFSYENVGAQLLEVYEDIQKEFTENDPERS